MIIIAIVVISVAIYLIKRDGPFISETHVCYMCLNKNRIQPHNIDITEQEETTYSEELKDSTPDDRI